MIESILPPVITGNKYLHSLVILAIFFIIARVVLWIIQKYLLKLTAKTATDLDDKIVRKTDGPLSLIIFLAGIRLALIPLNLEEIISTNLNKSASTVILIIVAYALCGVTGILAEHWSKKTAKANEQVASLFKKAAKIFLLILAVMFILRAWEIQIGPLLASLGIAGITIAFALQSTLGNIFGGVSLILDKSIKVGDIVKVDEETYGAVIDVGLRSTKIRTWNNELMIVPNGKLANSEIKNYVLPDKRARVVVPFNVAYGTKIDKVEKVVMGEIKKLKNVLKDPKPFIAFLEMGDSSLKFKAMVWIESYKERFSTKVKLTKMIYDTLNKNKIGIPFPQVDVHLKKK